jgi:hypothetical protein
VKSALTVAAVYGLIALLHGLDHQMPARPLLTGAIMTAVLAFGVGWAVVKIRGALKTSTRRLF